MHKFYSGVTGRLREFHKYRDLLKLLVSRDLKLKYRRSILGYLWSVLNPLLIMAVMSAVFSTVFSRDIENFPVYLFCGQLLFNFMNNATRQAIFSVTGNAALLKKSYVPRYIFTVAKISGAMADLVFSMAALLIVMMVTGARISWTVLLIPLVGTQLYLFCIGLGLLLAQANVFFRDTQFLYNAVTTAWMYLTPIFYPLEILPGWLMTLVRHGNPMFFYVQQFRDLVYSCRLPDVGTVLSGCAAAAVMLFIGIWSFSRTEDRFILYI